MKGRGHEKSHNCGVSVRTSLSKMQINTRTVIRHLNDVLIPLCSLWSLFPWSKGGGRATMSFLLCVCSVLISIKVSNASLLGVEGHGHHHHHHHHPNASHDHHIPHPHSHDDHNHNHQQHPTPPSSHHSHNHGGHGHRPPGQHSRDTHSRAISTDAIDNASFYEDDPDQAEVEEEEDAGGQDFQQQVRFKSSFSCRDRHPGYYADMDLNCEVYHLCTQYGGGLAFDCPRGTRFQQRTMVCDHWFMVDCPSSDQYYDNNLRIGQRGVKFIDDDEAPSSVPVMQLMIKESTKRPPKVSRPSPQVSQPRRRPKPTRRTLGRRRDPKFMQVVVKEDALATPKQQQQSGGQSARNVFDSRGVNGIPLDDQDATSEFKLERDRTLRRTQGRSNGQFGRKTKRIPTQAELDRFGISRTLVPPAQDASVAAFEPRLVIDLRRSSLSVTPTPQALPVASALQGHLPREHPFNGLLPPSARVVAVKPLRSFALSNRDNNPSIMTLSDFLDQFPNITNILTVPVEVRGAQVRMIEQLVAAQKQEDDEDYAATDNITDDSRHLLSSIRKPSDALLIHPPSNALIEDELLDIGHQFQGDRDARRVDGAKNQANRVKSTVTVQPRGGGAGPRFSPDEVTQPPTDLQLPELEFGFQPLPISTTTATPPPTPGTTRIDAPTKASKHDDAFFFTTTKAPPVTVGGNDLNELLFGRGKTSPFDMRDLFYIPPKPKQKPVQAKQLKPLRSAPTNPNRFRGGRFGNFPGFPSFRPRSRVSGTFRRLFAP